jgi:hypothetical protein
VVFNPSQSAADIRANAGLPLDDLLDTFVIDRALNRRGRIAGAHAEA